MESRRSIPARTVDPRVHESRGREGDSGQPTTVIVVIIIDCKGLPYETRSGSRLGSSHGRVEREGTGNCQDGVPLSVKDPNVLWLTKGFRPVEGRKRIELPSLQTWADRPVARWTTTSGRHCEWPEIGSSTRYGQRRVSRGYVIGEGGNEERRL